MWHVLPGEYIQCFVEHHANYVVVAIEHCACRGAHIVCCLHVILISLKLQVCVRACMLDRTLGGNSEIIKNPQPAACLALCQETLLTP